MDTITNTAKGFEPIYLNRVGFINVTLEQTDESHLDKSIGKHIVSKLGCITLSQF